MHPTDFIGAGTRYCAVFGYPVRHSASPAMQNAGLADLGLDWRYLAFEVRPAGLRQALAGAAAMRFIGVNLTIPHKLAALELMDELDDSARTWGAVNTVRFEIEGGNGNWLPLGMAEGDGEGSVRARGFNTDADAIVQSVEEDLSMKLAGAKVALLGAGGAGRTAALRLAAEGVEGLWLVNRTEATARGLQAEIARRFPKVRTGLGYPDTGVDLLVNATPLGLKESDPLPLDVESFPPSRAGRVYDMIYRPAETPLLKRARAEGCQTANGLGMLLRQGAKALEIWSGRPAPLKVMRLALEKHVYA